MSWVLLCVFLALPSRSFSLPLSLTLTLSAIIHFLMFAPLSLVLVLLFYLYRWDMQIFVYWLPRLTARLFSFVSYINFWRCFCKYNASLLLDSVQFRSVQLNNCFFRVFCALLLFSRHYSLVRTCDRTKQKLTATTKPAEAVATAATTDSLQFFHALVLHQRILKCLLQCCETMNMLLILQITKQCNEEDYNNIEMKEKQKILMFTHTNIRTRPHTLEYIY